MSLNRNMGGFIACSKRYKLSSVQRSIYAGKLPKTHKNE